MGVPGFFLWLRRKYPQIVEECATARGQREEDSDDRECDNLYIDMNHIIHGCSHPRWRDSAYESEAEMFRGIQAYLERLVQTCRPQRLLMIAIDGVAPQAKMCQQRTRRFMSAYSERKRRQIELEVRREMTAQAKNAVNIPAATAFDGNVITPGTPFMARLVFHLQQFVERKVANDPDWQCMQILISDANEPGEGEHKIMRFIRHQRTCPEYDPNTRHVIYGQDADLILLALLTHEPHFALLREAGNLEDAAREMGVDPSEWSAAKHQPLQFLNVSTLREYLRYEFQDLVGTACNPPSALSSSAADPWHQQKQEAVEEQPEQADEEAEEAEDTSACVAYIPECSNGQFDFERVLQDFVLLTFLAGNDFLPSVPSLEIYGRPSGLDIILKTYKEILPALGGPITNGSVINPDCLKRILTKLAEDEEDAFQRLATKRARDFQRMADKENQEQNGRGLGYRGPDGSGQWVSMGELGEGGDLDEALGSLGGEGPMQSEAFDIMTATPNELSRELAARVAKRLDDTLKGASEADPVRLSMPGYRARLYEQRFQATAGEGVEKTCRKVSHTYVQGLTWVLAYYVHGNTPVPVSSTHTEAVQTASSQVVGKGKQNSAADSREGLGASWDWFYPYHYAPLVSDLAKHATGGKRNKATIATDLVSVEDDSWAPANGPVRPLVQLMAVLPPESARACLPMKLARIMEGTRAKSVQELEQTSVAAALADMFPSDLAPLIDMSGKMYTHTAVVKLPFANVKRLAAAAQQADPDEQELSTEDEERNELRAGNLTLHYNHPCALPLRLISRQGMSWEQSRLTLTSPGRPSWSAQPGKLALSMTRLLVPRLQSDEEPKEQTEEDSTNTADPTRPKQLIVSVAGFDIAGVPTTPFSACLLAGCKLPEAVVSERDWQREQRKFAPALGGGRGGRTSSGNMDGRGGRGYAQGGKGYQNNRQDYPRARSQGARVLEVPIRKAVPIPIRQPTEAPLTRTQRDAFARQVTNSGLPDWGSPSVSSPGFSPGLDDEAVARQLQRQYDREVQGPAGTNSLDNDSFAVARQLQEEEDRRARINFHPTRVAAAQMKKDEDFALRMQRQENQIAAAGMAQYQESQRRHNDLDAMGGVPPQSQDAQLHEADFPGLPAAYFSPSPSSGDAPAPIWPIKKCTKAKATARSGHIAAVHGNSSSHGYNNASYQSWDEDRGQSDGWGGSGDQGGWGDEDPSQAGRISTGDESGQGPNGHQASKVQSNTGQGQKASNSGAGWGDGDANDYNHIAPQQANRNDWANSNSNSNADGWGAEQTGNSWGASHMAESHSSSGNKPLSRSDSRAAAAAQYMQSVDIPTAGSIKERAAAAAAKISSHNARRQQQCDLDAQQYASQPPPSSRPPAPAGTATHGQAQSAQQYSEAAYPEPTYNELSYALSTNSQSRPNQPASQPVMSQFSHLFPEQQNESVAQPTPYQTRSAAPSVTQTQPAKYQQPALVQSSVPGPAKGISKPANDSAPFDLDAWLDDLGEAPQNPTEVASAAQSGLASVRSSYSSDSSTAKPRYMPPHLRSPPGERAAADASQQPPAKKAPPGFGGF